LHTAYVGCEFEALEMTPSFAASWKTHTNLMMVLVHNVLVLENKA